MSNLNINSFQADEETGTSKERDQSSKAKSVIFAVSILMTMAAVAVFSTYVTPVGNLTIPLTGNLQQK